MNYKFILKKEGISIAEFARHLHISRPTAYKLLKKYESGTCLPEPYQSIFDAFFFKERNSMNKTYECRNGNLIVEIINNTAVNANGTVVINSETRGKRDIVSAKVIVGDDNIKVGTTIFFSYYAGQAFTLEDKEVFIVNKADIKFVSKEE